jgi:GTP-binding protein EngB required for normal cell division
MMEAPERELGGIAGAVEEAVDRPTPSQRLLLDRLALMSKRLSESTFQLAVLGQFKRGKSTLLNALLGYPLLNAGILPLTAVPTFLFGSPTTTLRLKYATGTVEEQNPRTPEDLTAAIAAATTEEYNPHNLKGLERVDVGVSFSPWLNDLVLIDTPGIGSTHSHNTHAAHAVLPECDAALFVVSADPPITEAEVEYLAAICRTVSRIIIILNKVDLVDRDDRENAIRFLTSVIAQHDAPQIDPKVFPVSARAALAARQNGDCDGLEASGVPALERYLRSTLIDQKHDYLETSVARKTADIVSILHADATLAARALTIPLADLDEKIGFFEAAATDFVRERDNLQDLLAGEWRRMIVRLDVLCEKAEKGARSQLEAVMAEINGASQPGSDQSAIQSVMSMAFDEEFKNICETVDKELTTAITEHQRRYCALAGRVRDTAAALMEVSAPPLALDNWFQIKREPYWIGEARVESLSSITADGLARFLPAKLRRERRLKQLRVAVDRAINRNISDLRWTMRQNIDNSFRRLLDVSGEAVDASIAATREVLSRAQGCRRDTDRSLQVEIEHANDTTARLAALRDQINQHINETG